MRAEDLRDAVVDALRRDLVGPMADPAGHFPRAEPRILRPGDPSPTGPCLTIADDGEEVVVGGSPVGWYLVGALYPDLTERDAHDADTDQGVAPAQDAPPDDDAAAVSEPDADAASEGTDEDTDRSGGPRHTARPSAFGMTVGVRADVARLTLRVCGGWYSKFPLSGGYGWHRHPVEQTREVILDVGHRVVTVDVDAIALEIGVYVRAEDAGHRTVTCYLRNRTPQGAPLPSRVLFGAELSLSVPTGALVAFSGQDRDPSPEAGGLRLLYSTTPVRAVGHGVDVATVEEAERVVVRTVTMPVAGVAATTPDIGSEYVVAMDDLATWSDSARATVDHMIDGYRRWIDDQRGSAGRLHAEHRPAAERHLAMCESFLAGIEEGWALAARDAQVQACLRWASEAMATQRRSYAAQTRRLVDGRAEGPEPGSASTRAEWRPFQLAFILANLAAVTDPAHARRGVVDVVWMPTGGGKTEAYLGLAAFTMLYRRMVNGPKGRGTAVIMRYTLRLLTAQQLQRAASLICALELIRDRHPDELEPDREFSIGAWLGRASTPNRHSDALAAREELIRNAGDGPRPFLLSRCPSCATEMGVVSGKRVTGYRVDTGVSGRQMKAHCPNDRCRFHTALPVFEVDESIYRIRPTFIVATVDKFAQLAWNEKVRGLLGIGGDGRRGVRAPELIIQDELHLISGPLGSLVGLYESALEQLCIHDGGDPPHIVAATATTRAYARQAEDLYGCDAAAVRLVPPPGLDIADSFFARRDDTVPARQHLAVCGTGTQRFDRVLTRVAACLAHVGAVLETGTGTRESDPYWTNVMFFGSLRDLGRAKSLIDTELRMRQWQLTRRSGQRTGSRTSGERRAVRRLTEVELTSASSGSAAQALERLTRPQDHPQSVDLALATSVIEVGVDVDRLGMLTVVRQPKAAAQYIQVSGRVGRRPSTGPGLVVVLLDPHSSRDFSHYERFGDSHSRLFASVEPAGITPFTPATLLRGLRGTVASVVRQTRAGGAEVDLDDVDLARRALDGIAQRATAIGGHRAGNQIRAMARKLLDELGSAAQDGLVWGHAGRTEPHQFLRPADGNAPAPDRAEWSVLTSLRNVDGSAALQIKRDWLPRRAATPPRAPAGPTAAESEW